MSMASLLALVEQTRLRWQIGSLGRPLNPRLTSGCAVHGRIDIAIAEAKVELARRACVRGVSQSFSGTVGHPDEAAAQRTLGRHELGHFPSGAQAIRKSRDPFFDQLAAEAASDEVHVGPGVSGPRG